MRAPRDLPGMDTRGTLSLLWIFLVLNFLYCDVIGLHDAAVIEAITTGTGPVAMTPAFLLGAGVLMEIPMGMVLLSRLLGRRAGRVANITAGVLMIVVQCASLFAGTPSAYYVFYSAIEIATLAVIVAIAWRWREDADRTARDLSAAQPAGAREVALPVA